MRETKKSNRREHSILCIEHSGLLCNAPGVLACGEARHHVAHLLADALTPLHQPTDGVTHLGERDERDILVNNQVGVGGG